MPIVLIHTSWIYNKAKRSLYIWMNIFETSAVPPKLQLHLIMKHWTRRYNLFIILAWSEDFANVYYTQYKKDYDGATLFISDKDIIPRWQLLDMKIGEMIWSFVGKNKTNIMSHLWKTIRRMIWVWML